MKIIWIRIFRIIPPTADPPCGKDYQDYKKRSQETEFPPNKTADKQESEWNRKRSGTEALKH